MSSLNMSLHSKTILITGGAMRVGRSIALAVAKAGGDLVVHYGKSAKEAGSLQEEIEKLGRKAFLLRADLSDPSQVAGLIDRAREYAPLFALINNASVFEPGNWEDTSLEQWNRTMAINLTTPFLLCQAFARSIGKSEEGRIVNLLDWRALRPGTNNLAYTISKAGLAALTHSLAISLAPHITVNGLALGAILPPSSGEPAGVDINRVPAKRWANLIEVDQAVLFLLDGPAFITGEIIHLDGGRHLV
jgi:NAD(P)-dependent dehydrogenase (short-subunit alcohol dehydrogenase family)